MGLAIEGDGYFVLTKDATEKIYTFAGAFAVDAAYKLVDPSTGYKVGTSIHVSYDVPMQPVAKTTITMNGNLSSDGTLATSQKQKIVFDFWLI